MDRGVRTIVTGLSFVLTIDLSNFDLFHTNLLSAVFITFVQKLFFKYIHMNWLHCFVFLLKVRKHILIHITAWLLPSYKIFDTMSEIGKKK